LDGDTWFTLRFEGSKIAINEFSKDSIIGEGGYLEATK